MMNGKDLDCRNRVWRKSLRLADARVGRVECAKMQLEKDRGFQNPQGIGEGYRGVGVRVHILLPPTNPYPWRGYRG